MITFYLISYWQSDFCLHNLSQVPFKNWNWGKFCNEIFIGIDKLEAFPFNSPLSKC